LAKRSLLPIILCGGSGTRLWPLSRASYPKQFWNLPNKDDLSLLQKTLQRLNNLENLKEPIIICNEEHRFIAAEQLREIEIKASSIILETCQRNTAPAIAIAALKALEDDEDPFLLVLAADHEIKNINNFHKVINSAREIAEKDLLITFGVIPNSIKTGYGYIQAEKELNSTDILGSKILKFIEKPNKDIAAELIKDNKNLWNSGIFLFKASTILKEIDKFKPEISQHCKKSLEKSKQDLDFLRLNKSSFEKCENIAIDVAVMEKTNKGFVLPLNAGWSDIGCWKALWESSNKDANGNVLNGNTIVKQTNNCYVRSEDRLVVGIGLNNLAIIETDDAILVSNIDQTQDVKKIVKILEDKNLQEGLEHKKIFRPWGNYTTIVDGKGWKVKKIEVDPGKSLSLQMHKKRSEHWVVVKGSAIVELESEKYELNINESTYIPLGSKHRLSNKNQEKLELIEVQSGSYLGEDDIIRFQDNYGR